jgi:hypothetical protein
MHVLLQRPMIAILMLMERMTITSTNDDCFAAVPIVIEFSRQFHVLHTWLKQ